MANKKIMEIERLRGVAVLMVLFVHADFFNQKLPYWIKQTWSGVDLFFVISGYIVSFSLFKYLPKYSADENIFLRFKKTIPTLKEFYKRRIYRIFPLSFFWAIVPLILAYALKANTGFPGISRYTIMQEIFSVLTFQYNFAAANNLIPGFLGNYWSLSVEEQFYFLLPILLIWFPTDQKRIKFFLIVSALTAFIIRPFIPYTGAPEFEDVWIRFTSYLRFDSIFMGVCLFILKYNSKLEVKVLSRPMAHIWTFLFIGILWLLPGILIHGAFNRSIYTILTIASLGLVFLASEDKNYVLDIPIIKTILEYVGTRSFALYVINFISLKFLKEFQISLNYSDFTMGLIWLALTFMLAELSFRFIETPFIRLGRKTIS